MPEAHAIPEKPAFAAEADWPKLARLFANAEASFRHQLGLSRSSAQDFYAPTAEASAIRAQKEAILDAADGEQYLFGSAEGLPALHEFAVLAGCTPEVPASALDRKALSRAVTLALEPDWILVAPPDWTMTWASVCFPTRWSLAGKGLQPVAAIHAVVPGLNVELGRKIGVFFERLQIGEGWARANWGLSTSAERNQHPSRPYTPLSSETPMGDVFVRLESQHLQKLPRAGAAAFGIRILNFALGEVVAGYPEIAAGLKERLRTMPAEIAAYKGIPADFWRRF
jgi:hypothetical protein